MLAGLQRPLWQPVGQEPPSQVLASPQRRAQAVLEPSWADGPGWPACVGCCRVCGPGWTGAGAGPGGRRPFVAGVNTQDGRRRGCRAPEWVGILLTIPGTLLVPSRRLEASDGGPTPFKSPRRWSSERARNTGTVGSEARLQPSGLRGPCASHKWQAGGPGQ